MATSTCKLISGTRIPLIGYGTYQMNLQDTKKGVMTAL